MYTHIYIYIYINIYIYIKHIYLVLLQYIHFQIINFNFPLREMATFTPHTVASMVLLLQVIFKLNSTGASWGGGSHLKIEAYYSRLSRFLRSHILFSCYWDSQITIPIPNHVFASAKFPFSLYRGSLVNHYSLLLCSSSLAVSPGSSVWCLDPNSTRSLSSQPG